MAGFEAVKKSFKITYPSKFEELTGEKIIRIVKKNIRPKKKKTSFRCEGRIHGD